MANVQKTNTLIVGAGPIGIELAVVLKHLGVDYIHVEAGQVGHTISWYPKQARFFSSSQRIAIAGVSLQTPDQEKATREQYLAYLRGVIEQFDLSIATHQPVTRIERDADTGMFAVTTQGRADTVCHYAARHVVLAIGDMHRPRRLGVPGEDLAHVSHYFDEPHAYFRKRLLIVGGKNSAVETALRCHRAGAQVAMSYRREAFDPEHIKYWLLPEIKSLIKHQHIVFYPGTQPTRLTSTHAELAAVANTAGQPVQVEADFVLLLTGYEMDHTLFEQVGVVCEGENRAPTVDPDTMQSSIVNLFVVGTAVAGTQRRFRLFIENCHPHVAKVAKAIAGVAPPAHLINPAASQHRLPES